MGRSWFLGVLAALVAAAVVVTSADARPHAGRVRHCQAIRIHAGEPRIAVTTTRTRCTTARRLVLAWRRRLREPHTRCLWRDGSDRPGICTVDHWRCRSSHTTNGHNYPVVCQRGPQRVRFIEPL